MKSADLMGWRPCSLSNTTSANALQLFVSRECKKLAGGIPATTMSKRNWPGRNWSRWRGRRCILYRVGTLTRRH